MHLKHKIRKQPISKSSEKKNAYFCWWAVMLASGPHVCFLKLGLMGAQGGPLLGCAIWSQHSNDGQISLLQFKTVISKCSLFSKYFKSIPLPPFLLPARGWPTNPMALGRHFSRRQGPIYIKRKIANRSCAGRQRLGG
jgi:hypothetical protein